jgi:hypothetical protein
MPVDPTQRAWARLAGLLFLAAIFIAFGAGSVLSHIAGSGTFLETAARIAASERLYRAALSSMALVSFSSALLAFALYATLKPLNSLLAQLAMIFSLADSFLALVVRMCGFVRLHLYISAQSAATAPVSAQAFSDLMRSIAATTENIGGIAFGIGSCLFFFLFYKSRYIPRAISILGLVSALIWTSLYFATLVFPEYRTVFQSVCVPPMALTDVLTGFWLMLFSVGAMRTVASDPGAANSLVEKGTNG